MEVFLKAAATIVIALVFYLVLSKQGTDISVLLTVTVCCIVFITALNYLEPVIDFVNTAIDIGKLDSSMLQIVLKAAGIGIVSEITLLVCTDSGNAALGKTLQILGSSIVLWLSIPLFTKMLELIEAILATI